MLVVSSSNANMGSTNHKLSDWFWMSKVEMHRSSKCWIITRRGLKWTEINLHHPDCAGPAGGGALLVAEACSGGLGFLLSRSVSPWYMVLIISGSKLMLDINILQCKESPDIAAGGHNKLFEELCALVHSRAQVDNIIRSESSSVAFFVYLVSFESLRCRLRLRNGTHI